MVHRTDHAILLRTRPIRDADLLVTVFTEAEGKLIGVAPNARRSQRRFGGALEPGTIGEVAYVEREGQELVRIESVRVTWSPLAIRHRLDIFAAVGILLEVADATTVERQGGKAKFVLLRAALERVADAPLPTAAQFLMRWLTVTGFQPNFDHCVRCGRSHSATATARFLPIEGGVVCDRCWRGKGQVISLTSAARAWWGRLTGEAWVAGDAREWSDCREVVQEGPWQSICHTIGRPLKSRRYWEMLWDPANAS